jgi:hypothetical protein
LIDRIVEYLQANFRGASSERITLNRRDATYTTFFIIISALHVSGGFSSHHQELIKLYVQPWVLSCFPAVYRWCGLVGSLRQQESMTMPKAAHTVL